MVYMDMGISASVLCLLRLLSFWDWKLWREAESSSKSSVFESSWSVPEIILGFKLELFCVSSHDETLKKWSQFRFERNNILYNSLGTWTEKRSCGPKNDHVYLMIVFRKKKRKKGTNKILCFGSRPKWTQKACAQSSSSVAQGQALRAPPWAN